MAESDSMKILEVCRVAPPPDSSSNFSLPLIFLDMFWLQVAPTSRLFFYEFPQPNIQFSQFFLPKLKHSLSLTLQHYLPLAGNLTWPQDSDKPIVQYNTGDGISLTIAESQADFHHLSGNHFRDFVDLHSLLPDYPNFETGMPAMTLQITLFPSNGFSIGYVAHHGVMDGKSVSMFIHSWAYICKNVGDESTLLLPLELTPSYDRALVEQQEDVLKSASKGGSRGADFETKALPTFDTKAAPPDAMLGTFKLTPENIEALKKKSGLANATHVSTFTITSAYVWICLMKARKLTTQKAYLLINVESRGRLVQPIPSTYFGNCMLAIGGGGDTKDFLGEDGFALAVGVISEALAVVKEGAVRVVEKITSMMSSLTKEDTLFSIAGSPRFALYKADFGWGKPRKVEMISIGISGAFYLSDHSDGNGGIEIGVGLQKNQTQVFASLFASGLRDL